MKNIQRLKYNAYHVKWRLSNNFVKHFEEYNNTDSYQRQQILQYISNKDILRKMKTNTTLRKRQLKFIGYIIRKEGSENLTLIRQMEGKKDRRAAGHQFDELVWMDDRMMEGGNMAKTKKRKKRISFGEPWFFF